MHLCSFQHGALVGISPERDRTAVGARARISAFPQMSAQPLDQNVKQAPSASNNQPHLSLSQISNVFLLPICLKPFNLQLQSRKRKLFLLCSSYFYLRSLSDPLLVLLLRSWPLSKLETFLACLNSKDHFMQKIT